MSFTEALVKANIGVQKKLSPVEMKEQRRERSRIIKNKMQEQWNKNSCRKVQIEQQKLTALSLNFYQVKMLLYCVYMYR